MTKGYVSATIHKMKIKVAILSVFFTLLGILMSSQINTVSAQSANSAGPITSSATAPITVPAVTYFYKISGNVSIASRLNVFKRYFIPAKGVMVTAQLPNSDKKISTVTDSFGNYIFTLKPGTYVIKPVVLRGITYSPTKYTVTLKKDTTRINFIGNYIITLIK